MTDITRRQAFDQSAPDLTDAEIEAALSAGRVSISFRGEPVMISKNEIGFIALKFAMLEGDTQTILLDQFAARVLHGLIETANRLDWKPDGLTPPGTGH